MNITTDEKNTEKPKNEKQPRIEINIKVKEEEAQAALKAAEQLGEVLEKANVTKEKLYPSTYVERINDEFSRVYTIDQNGNKVALGIMPTRRGLENPDTPQLLSKKMKELIDEGNQTEAAIYKNLLDAITPSWAEGAKQFAESMAQHDREITERLQESLKPVGEALKKFQIYADEQIKNFSDLFNAVQKYLENNPVYALYLEELAALKEDPEYAEADLDRPALDYEDDEQLTEADTLHNKAVHIAMDRAEAKYAAQQKQEKQEEQDEQPLLFDEQNEEALSKKNTTKISQEAAATFIRALSRKLPAKVSFPNTKVIQDLQKPGAISRPNDNFFESKELRRKGKQISNYVLAFYDEEALADMKDIKGNPIKDRLTQDQIRIFNAISTICENYPEQEQVFTLPRLSRIIKQTDGDLSEIEEANLARELWRLTGLTVNIDATDTFKARDIPLDKANMKGKFIELRALEVDMKGGGSYTVYKIIQPPIAYQHAKLLGQIKTVPAAILDIREAKDKTTKKITHKDGTTTTTLTKTAAGKRVFLSSDRLTIRDYLALRIEIMKEKNEDEAYHNVILFDDPKGQKGLYRLVGKENGSRAEKQRIRDFCYTCLDFWKSIEYIKGYKIRTKAKTQEAIEIFL